MSEQSSRQITPLGAVLIPCAETFTFTPDEYEAKLMQVIRQAYAMAYADLQRDVLALQAEVERGLLPADLSEGPYAPVLAVIRARLEDADA